MNNVTDINEARPSALEFFAGIGLARVGLEAAGFRVTWANDIEPDKKMIYETNLDPGRRSHYALKDIGKVRVGELPPRAAIAWASSPCTDLSLAGGRAGLGGAQSGTFWEFIRLLDELGEDRPPVAVLENVVGLATSRGGDDLVAALAAFNGLGYSTDVVVIDARRFVPQSRPRLFVVAALNPPVDSDAPNPDLRPEPVQWIFGDPELRTHRAALPLPPQPLLAGLGAIVEDMPESDDRWWDETRTDAVRNSLSSVQLRRINDFLREPSIQYRTAYRRTRKGVAVWEIRPDDISGCLRTARGGSSKQAVVRVGNGKFQVRWMTPREYARLMGAPDFSLEGVRASQALFGFGDAVVVPAVAWLAENYLMPLVRGEMELDVDEQVSADAK